MVLTNPLWVVNSRIKMQGTTKELARKYKGLIGEREKDANPESLALMTTTDGLIRIAVDEGVPAVWSGTIPSLVLVSNPAIKFSVYEYIKRKVSLDGAIKLEAKQAFLIGVVASLVATVITYPVQVVQAKSRVGDKLCMIVSD